MSEVTIILLVSLGLLSTSGPLCYAEHRYCLYLRRQPRPKTFVQLIGTFSLLLILFLSTSIMLGLGCVFLLAAATEYYKMLGF